MFFRLHPLRLEFLAREPLCFPAGKAANVLRGALGGELHRAGVSESLFAPAARPGVPSPSGLGDWPRPFVIRARHLDGSGIEPGAAFCFDLHVFDLRHEVVQSFLHAFAAVGRGGLGPGRGKAELSRVLQIGETGLAPYREGTAPLLLSLAPLTAAPSRLRVRFLSPTELKHEGAIVSRPEFPVLFGRVRDRIATLARLYGEELAGLDFQGTNARAAAVRLIDCRLRHEESRRRSSRTGQSHSIGGFVGSAAYEGELAGFLPWLHAARWTGVGRQAVWGKGEIAVEPVTDAEPLTAVSL